jgi:hypothetical protein
MAFRERALAALGAGTLGLPLGAMLVYRWDMAFGMVVGRGLLMWWMQRIIQRRTGIQAWTLLAEVPRPLLEAAVTCRHVRLPGAVILGRGPASILTVV